MLVYRCDWKDCKHELEVWGEYNTDEYNTENELAGWAFVETIDHVKFEPPPPVVVTQAGASGAVVTMMLPDGRQMPIIAQTSAPAPVEPLTRPVRLKVLLCPKHRPLLALKDVPRNPFELAV